MITKLLVDFNQIEIYEKILSTLFLLGGSRNAIV
jgi:hypothetical protein